MEVTETIQKFVEFLVNFINAVKALYNSIKGNEESSTQQKDV